MISSVAPSLDAAKKNQDTDEKLSSRDVITYAFESRSKWEKLGSCLFICRNLIAWRLPGLYLPISPILPTLRSIECKNADNTFMIGVWSMLYAHSKRHTITTRDTTVNSCEENRENYANCEENYAYSAVLSCDCRVEADLQTHWWPALRCMWELKNFSYFPSSATTQNASLDENFKI